MKKEYAVILDLLKETIDHPELLYGIRIVDEEPKVAYAKDRGLYENAFVRENLPELLKEEGHDIFVPDAVDELYVRDRHAGGERSFEAFCHLVTIILGALAVRKARQEEDERGASDEKAFLAEKFLELGISPRKFLTVKIYPHDCKEVEKSFEAWCEKLYPQYKARTKSAESRQKGRR